MNITPEMVKELRRRTGIGVGKCKEALVEAGGDIETAIANLRKAGMASAVKKEGREIKEGMIAHAKGKSAIAVVEIGAETDFVVQNERFQAFAKEVAQVAADQAIDSLETLIKARSTSDPSMTLDELRASTIQSLGENIQISRIKLHKVASGHSVAIYSHMGGKIVTVIDLKGSDQEEALAREVAMHAAAEAPEYLTPDEIPADVKAKEEEIARGQIQNKPREIQDKIVQGKLEAFYAQVCLPRQKFVKDPSVTIQQLIEKRAKEGGKPLSLAGFIRWSIE
ncbi:MAG: translation elongation factor Ts [Parachlamydiales bacterium]